MPYCQRVMHHFEFSHDEKTHKAAFQFINESLFPKYILLIDDKERISHSRFFLRDKSFAKFILGSIFFGVLFGFALAALIISACSVLVDRRLMNGRLFFKQRNLATKYIQGKIYARLLMDLKAQQCLVVMRNFANNETDSLFWVSPGEIQDAKNGKIVKFPAASQMKVIDVSHDGKRFLVSTHAMATGCTSGIYVYNCVQNSLDTLLQTRLHEENQTLQSFSHTDVSFVDNEKRVATQAIFGDRSFGYAIIDSAGNIVKIPHFEAYFARKTMFCTARVKGRQWTVCELVSGAELSGAREALSEIPEQMTVQPFDDSTVAILYSAMFMQKEPIIVFCNIHTWEFDTLHIDIGKHIISIRLANEKIEIITVEYSIERILLSPVIDIFSSSKPDYDIDESAISHILHFDRTGRKLLSTRVSGMIFHCNAKSSMDGRYLAYTHNVFSAIPKTRPALLIFGEENTVFSEEQTSNIEIISWLN